MDEQTKKLITYISMDKFLRALEEFQQGNEELSAKMLAEVQRLNEMI